MLLFLKATIPGGAAGDLFPETVEVHGHTRGGKFIAPHQAIRRKRHDPPPAPPAPAKPPPVVLVRTKEEQANRDAFAALIQRGREIKAQAREMAELGRPMRFTHPEYGDQLVEPEIGGKGWRTTTYQKDGEAFGHHANNSGEEAFAEVLRSGYKPPDSWRDAPAPNAVKPNRKRDVVDVVVTGYGRHLPVTVTINPTFSDLAKLARAAPEAKDGYSSEWFLRGCRLFSGATVVWLADEVTHDDGLRALAKVRPDLGAEEDRVSGEADLFLLAASTRPTVAMVLADGRMIGKHWIWAKDTDGHEIPWSLAMGDLLPERKPGDPLPKLPGGYKLPERVKLPNGGLSAQQGDFAVIRRRHTSTRAFGSKVGNSEWFDWLPGVVQSVSAEGWVSSGDFRTARDTLDKKQMTSVDGLIPAEDLTRPAAAILAAIREPFSSREEAVEFLRQFKRDKPA